jgi:hypothetical protein
MAILTFLGLTISPNCVENLSLSQYFYKTSVFPYSKVGWASAIVSSWVKVAFSNIT